jgi:hypothetical protein
MLVDAIDHRVTLDSTEAAPEEFHDARIGIHRSKRLPILVPPSTRQTRPLDKCTTALIAVRSHV